MLTLLEEVVLLTVDEKTGKLRSPRGHATAHALAGALFFDLALAKRIDTDTEDIHVIDSMPTGNPVTDYFLGRIADRKDLRTVRDWIEEAFLHHEYLEEQALRGLTERGILKHEKTTMLWVIDVERYPMVNQKPQQDVKLRLAQAILGDTIPETRDIMLVSLADVCGLLGYILGDSELRNRAERIKTLSNLETISRTVAEAIAEREARVYSAIQGV